MRTLLVSLLAFLLNLGAARLVAQDLAITNARVIVGSGTVINSGTRIVRGGNIVSVSATPVCPCLFIPPISGG